MIAVVTATTGRAELQRTMDSVAAQTVPCQHYIFFDGMDQGHEYFVNPTPDNKPRIVHTCKLPVQTGGGGLMNAGIVAASAFLVQEPLICWLDDDNWFEPDHLERLLAAKGDKPYAWSLRKLVEPDGEFWGNDDSESIGPWGEFIDLNCYLMDRNLALQIAPLWYRTTGELMVGDRFIYRCLADNKVEGAGSGAYTVNYRLNPKRDLRAWFFERNLRMRGQFPDGFPWSADNERG